MKKKENSSPMTCIETGLTVPGMPKDNKAAVADRPRNYSPAGVAIEAPKAECGLYLVATPIGNLGDISLARA